MGRCRAICLHRAANSREPFSAPSSYGARLCRGSSSTEFSRTNPGVELIAESIPHIVWLAAPDGSTRYFNRRGTDYTGCPPEANYDWNWVSLVHPEDAQRAQHAWEHATRTGTEYHLEYRIRRADGEFRWHAMRALPMRGPDAQILYWIGTATDIHDQKLLESNLRRSERQSAEALALLETLYSTSPVGFGFVDRDFRIVRMNESLAAISGAPLEEQIGRKVAEVMPRLWPQIEDTYGAVLEARKSFVNLEVVGEDAAAPNESSYWLASYYPVIVDRDVIGIGLVVVNITKRKRIEQSLHAADQQIRAQMLQLEDAFMHTVEVAMKLSEMRDPYTAGHERRVAEIAVAFGTELGFDADRLEGLRVAGYLHDIGKIMIPAEILAKPTKLTPAEYELIKAHPGASFDALKGVEFRWPVAEVALQHHERLDGSGYPRGLKGDAILLEARILAVADVVEAMSLHRPYRAGLGIEAALAEVERGRGVSYDCAVVDACLRLFREKGYAIPT